LRTFERASLLKERAYLLEERERERERERASLLEELVLKKICIFQNPFFLSRLKPSIYKDL
jgi:hypothetical protein